VLDRSPIRWFLLLVAASCCGGCQPLHAPHEAWKTVWTQEWSDTLREHLAGDLWQLNPQWSPVAEAHSRIDGVPAVERLRWRHPAGGGLTAGLSGADLSSPSAEGSAEEKVAPAIPDWALAAQAMSNFRNPGAAGRNSAGGLLTHEHLGVLRELARSDDLSGANAAIFLAQLDPMHSGGLSETLERLVTGRSSGHPIDVRGQSPEVTDAEEPAEPPTTDTSTSHSLRLRAAAAEAWCLTLARQRGKGQQVMAPALRALTRPKLPDELRGELFRGIARRVPPAEIPLLSEAANHNGTRAAPAEIRRAAIEACIVYALHSRQPTSVTRNDPSPSQSSTSTAKVIEKAEDASAVLNAEESSAEDPWPRGIWNLRWDEDPHVRRAFGTFVAILGHHQALPILREQLQDSELTVQCEALVSMGLLGTDEARAELENQATRKEESIRLHAVRALAAWGEPVLARYARDDSHQVRREAARQLGNFHSRTAAQGLREFLTDANPQVQQTALEATEHWPDELALPVLLRALRDSSLKTRQLALAQLERRRGEAITFPLKADREHRIQEAEALARRWNLPNELWTHPASSGEDEATRLTQLRRVEISNHLAALQPGATAPAQTAEIIEWLSQLTAEDLPWLEQQLPQLTSQQTEVLYEEVLPRLSPVYAALQDLTGTDVNRRRQAAQQLSRIAAGTSLSPAVVRRLRDILTREQDQLVWRAVMSAVMQEDAPENAQVALLALNHLWPDIRVLGCEYIAYHENPAHAAWLLPLFEDSAVTVQLAAVRAAARCRNPVVVQGANRAEDAGEGGLRRLLTTTNPQLRLAVAATLSRFGDKEAMHELVRLSLADNWSIRRDAVREMGASGQTRFVEQLIRVAWTETNHTVRHAAVASLNQLVLPGDRPEGLADVQNFERTIELWATWWEERKRGPAARRTTDVGSVAPSDADSRAP